MKARRIISLVLVLLGLLSFTFSLYTKMRVEEVRKSVHQTSGFLSNSPVDKEIKKALDKKVSSYDMPILLGMVGGVVFVVMGVGMFACCRRR